MSKLFSQIDDVFMLREIPFIPVKSAGKNQALRFVFEGETQPVMKVWPMEGESYGVGDYQSIMAQVCAAQIHDWLQTGQRGKALLMNGNNMRSMRVSDISVLVYSHQEAAQIRNASTLLEIPSVYLSSRDDAFEALEAQEVLQLLQTMMTPEREDTLRSASATSMMGLDALDIETLNDDEHVWDMIVEEFDDYR